MSAAPVPPASGLSDERLAELLTIHNTMQFCTEWRVIGELLAEIARTRSDAALGAALRDAFATIPRNGWITLGRVGVHIEGTNFTVIVNDECRALAARLSRSDDDG